jgi:FkbM family methyltransferase
MRLIKNILSRVASRKSEWELDRISRLPKIESGVTRHIQIDGRTVAFADGRSFEEQYRQIFQRGIYDFCSDVDRPLMIDAGANIGMGTLRFLQRFPQGRLVAFEPDPGIFSILEANVRSVRTSNVTLKNAALWANTDGIWFKSDKADAGRVIAIDDGGSILIPTEKLSSYLNQPVDFLKLDVEGAELTILEEAKEFLSSVRNLFVEYHSFIDQRQSLDTLLSLLTETGFRYNVEGTNRIHPYIYSPKIYSGMDGFIHIYAYRPKL